MIRYQDFVPRMLAPPGWFKEGDYESLEEAVDAANAWITENNIRIINI